MVKSNRPSQNRKTRFLIFPKALCPVARQTQKTAHARAASRPVLEMLLNRLLVLVDANLNAYFDDVSSEMALKKLGPLADLLAARGLKGYWQRQQ
jgi:hypothetical protein